MDDDKNIDYEISLDDFPVISNKEEPSSSKKIKDDNFKYQDEWGQSQKIEVSLDSLNELIDENKQEVPPKEIETEDKFDSDEDDEDDDQIPVDQNAQKKKKKSRNQKRIDEFTYSIREKEKQLNHLQMENGQMRARLQEQFDLSKSSQDLNHQYYDQILEFQQALLTSKMTQAIDDGDTHNQEQIRREQTKLDITRSNYSREKSEYERQKIQLQNQQYIPQTYPIHQEVSPAERNLNEWIDQNPWYKTPALKEEADEIGDELVKRLSINGEAEWIGTPTFFNTISKAMRERYTPQNQAPNVPPDQPKRVVSPMNRNTNVAPVMRSNIPSMAQNYQNSKGSAPLAYLDDFERRMAINLKKSPFMSDKEAIDAFARSKFINEQQIRKGRDPNKLQIS